MLRALRSRTARQAAVFAGGSVLVSGLGAVAKALLARNMSPEEFGTFAFALAFLLFLALFFDFGLFLPAARVAATTADPIARRGVVGAALVAYVPVAVAFSALVALLSLGVDGWFNVEGAGDAVRFVAPFALAFPFLHVAVQLVQGVGRLHVYSVSTSGAQILLVAVLVAVLAADVAMTATLALALHSASVLVAAAGVALCLRPVFVSVRENVARLVQGARAYGFQVYVGRLLGIGTYNMDVLMVAAFTDPASVGFYTLAAAIASMISLPVIALANALFPRMTREAAIDRRWLGIAVVVGVAGAGVVAVAAGPLVELVFSSPYSAVAGLVLPLGLAEAVRGVVSIYNSFLSAHGRGRELRNAAVVLTVSNLVLNLALIPPFGAMGAAWASLFALLANLLAHVVFYRRSLTSGELAPAQ